MLVNATLLIQDVQLLCFMVIFGVLALQRWQDLTRRWLWYSFLANAAGAIFDLFAAHLPHWISQGINLEMIPLSYALLNVSLVHFERRGKKLLWVAGGVLALTLPVFLMWRNDPTQMRSFALGDLAIAVECTVIVVILWLPDEVSTRAPRMLMGGFLTVFSAIELTRVGVAFLLHADPDGYSHGLEVTSAVAYIVDTSVLPLAFIWMMNARLEWDLLQQSIMDPLTRVLNRRGLDQALERELARCKRYGNDLTLAMVDLDHFKQLNDTHGHAAGDLVLTGVAGVLSRRLRETDAIGRFGGEEFVLLLPHTGAEESKTILQQLCTMVSEKTDLAPFAGVRVTASFGVTSIRGRKPIGATELLREADVALYAAKKNGRNRVAFFEEQAGVAEGNPGLHG